MTRTYDTTNRPRRTSKASGARGWYDSPEWKARSKAHLARNPYCLRCPAAAQLCDHIQPTRPDDHDGVLRGPIQSMCRPCHSANTMHCTAKVFVDHHPGAVRALLGQAAQPGRPSRWAHASNCTAAFVARTGTGLRCALFA